MMHILDADSLTYLHDSHPRITQRFREESPDRVGTTIIAKIEVLRGRFEFLLKATDGSDVLRAQQFLQKSERFLESIPLFMFDDVAARIFDQLRQTKGMRKIGRADLLIASIVLANKATLVTRNLRHFRLVPRLSVVNWMN